ncbi:MAG: Gfo/Idh/MocA family oxidoreductase [Anaerolineaceae bacterium]|jgi:predicted dehydrogenase|nr:Gfo/Idh/MocA family oxidoreductase [Anaerolineaceae bacterium]
MQNIGIIGCGKIAQKRHIPEYTDNPNANLLGFFDLNEARAELLAKVHGGIAYKSYQELLANEDIDAVSVCTSNDSHAAITIAALLAGKHVLCEKPMATTLADCEAMVETAQRQGKALMIGHNQRLTKTHIKAKELIASGLLGEVVSFRTTFGHGGPETWSIDPGKNTWFFDKQKAVMGAMADLGIHKTDLIHFLTGQSIVETTARLSTLDKRGADGNLIGVDDNAFCIYKLEGGAVGTMAVSWTHYGAEDNSTVIYGSKGIMRIYDDPDYSIKVITDNEEEILYSIDKIQTNDSQTKSGVIDVFVDCLECKTEPEISGVDVLRSMRVVFASIESSNSGQSVQINHN